MTTPLSKKHKKEEKKTKSLFPRIYRIITESLWKPVAIYWQAGNSFGITLYKRFSRGFTEKEQQFFLIISSSILLASILLVGYSFQSHLREVKQVQLQRAQLQKEQAYWQGVVRKYPGYRDGYFQLAFIAYKLGEKSVVLDNVEEALSLDPNFAPAKELERMIND